MKYHNNSEDKIIQVLDPVFIKEFLEKIRCHNPLEKWSDEMTPKQIYNFTFLKKYGIISVRGFNVVDNKITVQEIFIEVQGLKILEVLNEPDQNKWQKIKKNLPKKTWQALELGIPIIANLVNLINK